MTAKKGFQFNDIILWVAIILATAWAVFPLYWAIITSLKMPGDIMGRSTIIPFLQYQPTFFNWEQEFGLRWREISGALSNSLAIAGGATIIATFLGTLAGYGLARFRFYRWQNKDMALWFLSQRVLPPVVTVIPFVIFIQFMGLYDTVWALILANATFTMPFAVLIMRDVFKELPIELEESALVDGCSRFSAFWRIALPLAAPAAAAAAIICFAFAWNEFLFALILTQQAARPVTILIAGVEHTRGVEFWFVATRLLIAILPPAILALIAQRYIVRGLTFGAVKG